MYANMHQAARDGFASRAVENRDGRRDHAPGSKEDRMKPLRTTFAIAACVIAAGAAHAGDPTGVWATERNDDGNYLTVEVKPCGDKF